MKKIISLAISAAIAAITLTGCGASSQGKAITVLSREEGSGTRSAFEELVGIEETVESAEISDSTAVMITTVKGNTNALGYISLGSLGDGVKALKIDGAAATTENVKNGSYKISRPFNIVTKGEVSEAAQDFISFIMSKQGQSIIEDNKYISSGASADYTPTVKSGKVTVTGSTSVSPVMEKLKEAYAKVNPEVTVNVQQSDSSNGIQSTLNGICDIGMASRELKSSESDSGLVATTIALDGIAVIVNTENELDDITADCLKDIYSGKITDWEEVNP